MELNSNGDHAQYELENSNLESTISNVENANHKKKKKSKLNKTDIKQISEVDSLLKALSISSGESNQMSFGHKKLAINYQGSSLTSLPKITMESAKARYEFWATQPVPKFDGQNNDTTLNMDAFFGVARENEPAFGPIIVYTGPENSNPLSISTFTNILRGNCNNPKFVPFSSIRQEPLSLPNGFVWSDLTLNDNDDGELKELYTLLSDNYVEDDDNMFRFDYSPAFLKWALQPPGHRSDWHVGIRVASGSNTNSNSSNSETGLGKLVAFISAVPATISVSMGVSGVQLCEMVEINFLCVHKKLRAKRMAPVLISEITRRVNLQRIWYAVYTAGVVLPRPCGVARYWHRSLNPKKLVEIKFSHLTRNMTMARALKLYKLPDHPVTPGFRAMVPADIPACHALLQSYLCLNSSLYPVFTITQFEHWFTPRPKVVECYVVQRDGGPITDFVSYYSLPSSVMNHPTHKSLHAAYSFYNVSTATPWIDLMRDALIVARNQGYDVFNALDLMDNATFLEPLKFGIGDGHLNYYLFNFACPVIKSENIGLVLQ